MVSAPLFLVGMAMGLLASAPVGPVNVMAISRALRSGFLAGFAAGSGAILADALFAALAAFGVTAIAEFLDVHGNAVQMVGGLVLVAFGLATLVRRPKFDRTAGTAGGGALRAATASFLVTLTNPGAALGILAMVGSLGEDGPSEGDYGAALMLVAGLVVGAALWWAFVAGLAARFRHRLDDSWLVRLNRVAGVLILGFGVAVLGLAIADYWMVRSSV